MSCRILAISVILLACTDRIELVAPVAERSFTVIELNGRSLPAEISRFLDTQGQTCIETLMDGHLSFNSTTRFGFSLSSRVTCGGTIVPPSFDETMGAYTQSGRTIVFHPERRGLTAISTARIAGDRIELVGDRTSGARLTLSFAPNSR